MSPHRDDLAAAHERIRQLEERLAIERAGSLAPPRHRIVFPIVVGLGLVLALVLGLAALMLPRHSRTDDGPMVAPPLPPSSSVLLTVRAKPSTAMVRIDDGPPEPLPLVRDVPRDRDRHVVAVEADGYDRRVTEVSFERNVALSFDLTPSRDEIQGHR